MQMNATLGTVWAHPVTSAAEGNYEFVGSIIKKMLDAI
jgi:hypothetical protein